MKLKKENLKKAVGGSSMPGMSNSSETTNVNDQTLQTGSNVTTTGNSTIEGVGEGATVNAMVSSQNQTDMEQNFSQVQKNIQATMNMNMNMA